MPQKRRNFPDIGKHLVSIGCQFMRFRDTGQNRDCRHSSGPTSDKIMRGITDHHRAMLGDFREGVLPSPDPRII